MHLQPLRVLFTLVCSLLLQLGFFYCCGVNVGFLRNRWICHVSKRSTAGTAVTFSIHYPEYQNVRQKGADKRSSNHRSSTTETATKVIGEEY